MKKILVFAALAALVLLGMTSSAVAADVTGTWKLAAPQGGPGGGGGGGGRGPMERSLVLKQDGDKLTGKVVMKMGDNPPMETNIENGKVDGDNISFTTKSAGRGGGPEVVTTYKAKVSGNKMEGTQQRGEGQERPFSAAKE